MSSAAINQLLIAGDKKLTAIDRASIRRLEKLIYASHLKLEREISMKWGSLLDDSAGKDASYSEARARLLLEQLDKILGLIRGTAAAQVSSTHHTLAINAEESTTSSLIAYYEPTFGNFTRIPVAKVLELEDSMTTRLLNHSDDFVEKTKQVLVQGAIKGTPFRAMAKDLQKATGTALSRCETLVRTESMIASDTVRKDRYKQANIGYVQRIATMDVRICGHCAARAGSVYVADEAPQLLHPNDRCYNAPWKKSWHDLGLVDDAWIKDHYADVVARFGKDLPDGPAPFEGANGQSVPQPIWTPSKGFL